MSEPIVIAIDGPSASGKSTNAKIIAAALGYAYVDTGAMYRTLAWHALQQGVDATDAEAIAVGSRTSKMAVMRLRRSSVSMAYHQRGQAKAEPKRTMRSPISTAT